MQIKDLKNKKKIIKRLADYTADYYGFDFIEVDEKKNTGSNESIPEKAKINLLKTALKQNGNKRINGTKLFFYNKPILKTVGKKKKDEIILDILNLESAVAEALVLKTAIKILEDEGYKDIVIELNSIGDKESQKIFKKELTQYYRMVSADIKPIEKKKISTNPFEIFYSNKEYLKHINMNAPAPIDNLSAESYDHFTKVTEYIDNFGISYEINPKMVGEKRYFSKIIFKIFASQGGIREEVAFGGRYDELAGETLRRKKISAVGLHLFFKQRSGKLTSLRENKIDIHLLKIGSTAELKFLDIVDVFKKLHIPIKFSISENKISKQLKIAKQENAEKMIILGEYEAKNNKVLVRESNDSAQKEYLIKDLEKYAKKFLV